jgi:hypothetical protein
VGVRVGDRTDLASPAPERPNSTGTLFSVVLGTLLGHLLGTTFFALQSEWCARATTCFAVAYDPNVYRALLRGSKTAEHMTDVALEAWLFAMLIVGVLAGLLGYWLARRKFVTDYTDPVAFGWLNPVVQAVKDGDAFVVAYVLTKTSHEGFSVAYEGVVQHLALDEDQSVKLIILGEVDRFLVNVSKRGLKRIDAAASIIEQLHVTADEIANIALEVVRAPKSDVDAVEAEEGSALPRKKASGNPH